MQCIKGAMLLCCHAVTGRDLRAIFALLRKNSSGRVPAHAVQLLRSLAVMAHHQGPTTFFDFANEGAGIVRNTPLRFPGMPHMCQSVSELLFYQSRTADDILATTAWPAIKITTQNCIYS